MLRVDIISRGIMIYLLSIAWYHATSAFISHWYYYIHWFYICIYYRAITILWHMRYIFITITMHKQKVLYK